ncbi:MAG: hypothetical protein ABSG08_15790 [Terriglobales bacterium]|jgi:hypothetical protein
MNCVLGIRAEPSAFHWAIVTGTPDQPVLHAPGTESSPKTFSEAESLAWIRQRVLYILDTYKPVRVAVRYPERNAMGANTDSAKARCRVEGVVMEAASSKNVEVVTGTLATFGKHSGDHSLKDDLDCEGFRGLDWSEYKTKGLREAIRVAASLLPAH